MLKTVFTEGNRTRMSQSPMYQLGTLLVEDADMDALLTTRAIKAIPQLKLLWRARSGEEALCYLYGQLPFCNREQFPYPDLIILDLLMEGVDGLGVLKAIHDMPVRPKTLVFSHRADAAAIQACFDLGADAHYAKTEDLARVMMSLGWLTQR
jgi:two-component system, response regulator